MLTTEDYETPWITHTALSQRVGEIQDRLDWMDTYEFELLRYKWDLSGLTKQYVSFDHYKASSLIQLTKLKAIYESDMELVKHGLN